MHPYLIQKLADQHVKDMHAQATAHRAARQARTQRRHVDLRTGSDRQGRAAVSGLRWFARRRAA